MSKVKSVSQEQKERWQYPKTSKRRKNKQFCVWGGRLGFYFISRETKRGRIDVGEFSKRRWVDALMLKKSKMFNISFWKRVGRNRSEVMVFLPNVDNYRFPRNFTSAVFVSVDGILFTSVPFSAQAKIDPSFGIFVSHSLKYSSCDFVRKISLKLHPSRAGCQSFSIRCQLRLDDKAM